MNVDFRNFIGSTILVHSAKGSEWKEHKYIKKINGEYYYPDNYEGGRHLDDGSSSEEKRISTNAELDEETVNRIANDVIRGLFGNGAVRKEALGENYQKIQDRVNEIMKTSGSKDKSVSEKNDEEKKGNEVLSKVAKKAGAMKMSTIYSVYEERKKRGR